MSTTKTAIAKIGVVARGRLLEALWVGEEELDAVGSERLRRLEWANPADVSPDEGHGFTSGLRTNGLIVVIWCAQRATVRRGVPVRLR